MSRCRRTRMGGLGAVLLMGAERVTVGAKARAAGRVETNDASG